MIAPQEAMVTAGTRIEPGRAYGFFTDTTICIGCKACEVACKNWNELGIEGLELTGYSYDNSVALGARTWRHVAFIEQNRPMRWEHQQQRWLMMSDVCKHCTHAGCYDACPTGAIIRTEYDTIVIQPDVCNGCGYCVPACPFGVVQVDMQASGIAQKCTLCYDRLGAGMEPACAKACPTDSIIFGELDDLVARARGRVTQLHEGGLDEAYLWGLDDELAGGLNAFFLLVDEPQRYNLPVTATDPVNYTPPAARSTLLAALGYGLFALLAILFGGDGE